MYRRLSGRILLLIFAGLWCCSTAIAQTCGVISLFDLSQLVGCDLNDEQRESLTNGYPAEESSMLDIKQAAERLGLSLVGVAATLDELSGLCGPKIIHLNDPAHFLVLARASDEWVQLLDGGRVVVVPRAEIEKRYSGHALILDQAQFPEGGPRLEAPEFHHTFGIASVGQQVEHAFTVRNVGDQELVVRPQEKGCCGAPQVTISRQSLPPGESAEVTVAFTITYSGSVMKSAELLTTDPTQPVVFLTVHGQVPHDLRTYPDRLYLSGDKGAVGARTVTISGPAEMDLTEVKTERGLFDLDLSEPTVSEDEKKTWTLQLTFKPDSFVGEIADQLSITTTHAERPLITIPIAGRIRGDLSVAPPSVFLGFVAPGAQVQQTVTIASRSFTRFAVRAAVSADPKITVGEPSEADGVWRIPVSVDTSEPGVIDGKITVTTDVPGEETLEIPVYAHIIAQK